MWWPVIVDGRQTGRCDLPFVDQERYRSPSVSPSLEKQLEQYLANEPMWLEAKRIFDTEWA
jgi:hypothetical protein